MATVTPSSSNYLPPSGLHSRLGFYGCGRIVSVEWSGVGRPPKSSRVKCPCGYEHLVHPLWRTPKPGEKGEIVLAD